MKVLKCPCGVVKVGVPRKQKHCSWHCPVLFAARQAVLARNRALRTLQVVNRYAGLPLNEIVRLARSEGWGRGYRKGFAAALGER